MPGSETFLEQQIGDKSIKVIKTYDARQAREAFDEMDEAALSFLWDILRLNETYETSDIPAAHSGERDGFLWDAVLEEAREDGNVLSFFIVMAKSGDGGKSVYVAPDWPSAERYAFECVKPI